MGRVRQRRGCVWGGGLLLLTVVVAGAAWAWFRAPVRLKAYPLPAGPQPVVSARNGMDDFLAAARLAASRAPRGKPAGRGSAPANAEADSRQVAANADIFARVAVGLGKQCAIPQPSRYLDRPIAARDMGDLGRAMAARVRVLRAEGKYEAAVDAALDLLQVSDAYARNGMTVHLAIAGNMKRNARRDAAASVEHLTASEAEALGHRLDGLLAARPTLADACAVERPLVLQDTMDLLDKAPNGIFALLKDEPAWNSGAPLSVRNQLGRRLWATRRDKVLHEIDGYYACYCVRAPRERLAAVKAFRPVFMLDHVTWQVIYLLQDSVGALLAPEAQDNLLRCQLAIQAYRARHGALPGALTDLRLDARWTTDPFSGDPLIYRPAGSGYLLYSVGANGVDDGGDPTLARDKAADVGLYDLPDRGDHGGTGLHAGVLHMKAVKKP